MNLLVHIANVSDNEVVSVAVEMNPVFQEYKIDSVRYTWTQKEPYIRANLNADAMEIQTKPFITVMGGDFEPRKKDDLLNELMNATGLYVIAI